ncbi:MAG: hypothetical protein LBC76_08280 [Treponema sp.]|jgi:hypothetical protein|nr:hypothetical protein [Treponema sp.]
MDTANNDPSGKPARRIEVVWLRPSEIGTGFGNPRKPADKKNASDLRESLETLDDFGVLVVDENKDIIAGNQRLRQFIEIGDDEPKLCKQLIGYTRAEKRAINIKANTHAGTWDTDLLADWTADLNINLGINEKLEKAADERSIKEMELIHYEKYNYVLIACRNELDYNNLVRTLGIEDSHVPICKTRKIKARAIWYDKMKAKLVPLADGEKVSSSPKKAPAEDWSDNIG